MLARLASLRSKVGSTESHPTREAGGVAAVRQLSIIPSGGSAFARQRLLDPFSALGFGRFHPIQQAVWTGFEKLSQTGEGGDGDGVGAALDVSDGLPMHAHQFRHTFLRQSGFRPRRADALADESQELLVCHPD